MLPADDLFDSGNLPELLLSSPSLLPFPGALVAPTK